MEYRSSEYQKSEFETQSSIFEDQGVYNYNSRPAKVNRDESSKNTRDGQGIKPRNEEYTTYPKFWRTDTEDAVKSLEALNYE